MLLGLMEFVKVLIPSLNQLCSHSLVMFDNLFQQVVAVPLSAGNLQFKKKTPVCARLFIEG